MEAHSDRIFILRYEDLVTGCCDALERLSDWLAIEMAGFEVDRISSRSIGKYRDGLTHAELETVLEIAGPAMERLGYR